MRPPPEVCPGLKHALIFSWSSLMVVPQCESLVFVSFVPPFEILASNNWQPLRQPVSCICESFYCAVAVFVFAKAVTEPICFVSVVLGSERCR